MPLLHTLGEKKARIIVRAYVPVPGNPYAPVQVDDFDLVDWGSDWVERTLRDLSVQLWGFHLRLNRDGYQVTLGSPQVIELFQGSNAARLYPEDPLDSSLAEVDGQIVTLYLLEVVRPPPLQQ